MGTGKKEEAHALKATWEADVSTHIHTHGTNILAPEDAAELVGGHPPGTRVMANPRQALRLDGGSLFLGRGALLQLLECL